METSLLASMKDVVIRIEGWEESWVGRVISHLPARRGRMEGKVCIASMSACVELVWSYMWIEYLDNGMLR